MTGSMPGADHSRRPITLFAGCTLFLVLATALYVPHMLGAGCILLGLAGIIELTRTRTWNRPRLNTGEKLLVGAFGLYALIQLLTWARGADPGDQGLTEVAYLLTALPIYLLLRRVNGLERYVRAGLLVGCIGAGIYAISALATGTGLEVGRVVGVTSPLWFGGMSLAYGLMMLGLVTRSQARHPERILALIALAMALIASAASGSRGAWLALPVILIMYPLTLGRNFGAGWRWGLALLVAGLATVILFSPGMPLGLRVMNGTHSLASLVENGELSGTLGLRLEMWRLAVQTWLQTPVLGGGMDAFGQAIDNAVAEGRLDPVFLKYRHAHNAGLQIMVEAGLVGLLTLVALFAVPLGRCLGWLVRGHEKLGTVAWCGVVGTVVIATMGLTEAVFARNTGVRWYALIVALAYALAYRHTEGESSNRRADT